MKLPKPLPKRILIIGAVAGVVVLLALMLNLVFKKPAQSTPALQTFTLHMPEASKPKKVVVELPLRLKIPKINVDAALDYASLTPQGELDSPKGPNNAAWYYQGPRPGEKGSAVIDGHFGYKDNLPAVFDNLHELQKGDAIYVQDEKGGLMAFVVREIKTYGSNDDASEVFKSSDDKSHLNLITCQGSWSQAKKSYSGRLVVFADLEKEKNN